MTVAKRPSSVKATSVTLPLANGETMGTNGENASSVAVRVGVTTIVGKIEDGRVLDGVVVLLEDNDLVDSRVTVSVIISDSVTAVGRVISPFSLLVQLAELSIINSPTTTMDAFLNRLFMFIERYGILSSTFSFA